MAITFEIIGNLLSSAFLTYLVSIDTLTTKLQVIFVFLYFILMNYVFHNLYQKKIKTVTTKQIYRIYALTGVLAMVLTCLSIAKIYPIHYDSKIFLITQGESNAEAYSNEIWISNISVDDSNVDLSGLNLQGGWQYSTNDQAIYISPQYGEKIKNELVLPTGQNVSITFVKHEWSGIISIQNGESIITEDLYSKISTEFVCNLQRTAQEPDISIKMVLWLCYYITLYRVIALITAGLYCRYIRTSNNNVWRRIDETGKD